MFVKVMTLYMFLLPLAGCASKKPFQPPPPEYSEWIKNDVLEEGVKQAMKDCGYKDLYGYGDQTSANDVARRQNCMFKNGFSRRSGYKGLCSLKEQNYLPACMEK